MIESPSEVIKLAARAGRLDLAADFGLPEDRLAAFDRTTRLAVGAGLDALRDAGIPLVMRYKTTTTGTKLPDRWGLPEEMRDETGVIFASAFPGFDSLVGQMEHFHRNRTMRERLADLESLREMAGNDREKGVSGEIDRRIREIRSDLARDPYTFDRRFLFQVLAMGHSQLAELIGARGPNTQINAACASTTQAFALAQDWIGAGRCRRVIVVAADDVTSDNLLGWFGSGFLASGAAATDELVEDAALPFDRRRHGLIVGMGAAAAVIETADAARERGLRPICEVLGTVVANSAFHGSKLDVGHIGQVMETLVSQAEKRWGINRHEIAPQTVFLSHETYTPARGGSAQAEVDALRHVFSADADRVVVANTKGFTGHPMAVGIEDVVAVKSLETGLVPPVANIKERDPDFGVLNLSRGGAYPVRYALRLGAGFGSQISMSLLRWVPSPDGKRPTPDELGYAGRLDNPAAWKAWLARATGNTEVEVVNRTLRVVDRAKPQIPQMPQPLQPVEQPATAVAPPPPSVEVRVPSVSVPDAVQETVLALIAGKTGYPREMLALDLDLEADLGIDTVKQAEVFAAIRAEYGIPRDENLKLRDFPTLAHTIQFVYDRRPDLKTAVPEVLEVPEVPEVPAVPEVLEAGDAVRQTVLALIAEKTGYPPEMLDLDLDLEADLGIDTVKQAEMFAAIRTVYGIPRDENLKLRDYPTLGHTIQFVHDRRPDLKAAAAPAVSEETVEESVSETERPALSAVLEAPIAGVPRRVPVPVLRPPLGLCKPTGVTLGPGSRVVVAADQGGVSTALVSRLEKLGVEVLSLEALTSPETVQGIYWLPALDREADLASMDAAAWREANRVRVKDLYATLRTLYGSLGGPGTFLVSATRLGGRHGYDQAGALAPLGGAVTGLTKSFKREKPGALVKAVDFPAGPRAAGDRGHPDRGDAPRSGRRRDRKGGRPPLDDRARREAHRRAPCRSPSTATPCSWSPGRRGASSRPSSRIWPRPPAAARSTCSTWRPSPIPPIRTSGASPRTARG